MRKTQIPAAAIEVVQRLDNPFMSEAMRAEIEKQDPGHHERLRNGRLASLTDAVRNGEWDAALWHVGSHERLSLCEALWPIIPDAHKPAVLAHAISSGDNPGRMLWWLYEVLYDFYDKDIVAFYGDAARKAFDALPYRVTIYRGTVQAEVDQGAYGVCWTLSRKTAVFFATKHFRFRNTQSLPVILSAKVCKSDIGGLLFDRNESEVLICPEVLRDVRSSAP